MQPNQGNRLNFCTSKKEKKQKNHNKQLRDHEPAANDVELAFPQPEMEHKIRQYKPNLYQ